MDCFKEVERESFIWLSFFIYICSYMRNREKYIEKIVSGVRKDLKDETEKFLSNVCTNDEVQSIYEHIEKGTFCLDIEYYMLKHLMYGDINIEDVPGWELLDSMFYEAAREKFLPDVRKKKIDGLTND
jgi:hypothetical protein